MAKPNPKPDEPAKRSPGKSRFSLPRKETPQIDGSYLDRLFADFQQQTVASEQPDISHTAATAEPNAEPQAAESRAQVPRTRTGGDRRPGGAEPSTKLSNSARRERTPELVLLSEPRDAAAASAVSPAPPAVGLHGDETALHQTIRTKRLTPGEVNVLRIAFRLCRERGSNDFNIKIPQLAEETCLSDRQVQRILRNLQDFGLITKLADYSNVTRTGAHFRLDIPSSIRT